MLSLLHIENIAVIERADIEFASGLTVLTGETGAGKSIIIDSIGAIMGQRTSRELIRAGARKGFVSAVFTGLSQELTAWLCENQLEGEEIDTVHIQRQISSDGKSLCRVNTRPVPVSVLKQISPFLLNIHGQHDGQKLMDDNCHIDFLDCFAGLQQTFDEYTPLYHQLLSLKRQINELDRSEQERLQRLDMLSFHVEEIDGANLHVGEDEALEKRKAFFDNIGKLAAALAQAHNALDGDEANPDSMGAYDLLCVAANALSDLTGVSDELCNMAERANELKYLALDLRDAVAQQQMNTEFSPDERAMVEERLDMIYRLKQKYGSTIRGILEYADQSRIELDSLQSADERREKLLAEYKALRTQARETAGLISAARKTAALQLEKRIVTELSELDMSKVRLSVRVESGSKLTAKGVDTVSFLISVNPGETLRPLSKVASGGELSRVMLAMKNVLTEQEPVGTLIFDEIDTGVSGRAAQKIAYKLAAIGQKKQTLCVTHLPQIAAMGNNHMLITKSVLNGRAFTEVRPIINDVRTEEIARMISGDQITKASLANAAELLYDAKVKRTGDNIGQAN